VNVDTTTTCLLSSKKYKEAERPLEGGLKQVLSLRPVSYRLRGEYNPTGLGEQIGFFAEDVARVDPRLVSFDSDDGTPHAVRYQQLTALLTKAIQEQQRQIERLAKRVRELEGESAGIYNRTRARGVQIERLAKRVRELEGESAGIYNRTRARGVLADLH
jgi:hypothetical protein